MPPWSTMHRRTRSLLALLSAALLLTSACSDEDGVDGDEESTATTVADADIGGPSGAEAAGTWSSLLSMIPDTPGARTFVVMADVAGASDAIGIDRPAPTSDSDDIAGYLSEVFSVGPDEGAALPPLAMLTEAGQLDEEFRDELGWSLTQIDGIVEAGEPPEQYVGIVGDFDPAAVDAVLAEVPYWSGVQETVEYSDHMYYRWGEDGLIDPEHTSPARPLGIGGRMVVTEDEVMLARTDEGIEAMIDAVGGASLLDATDDDFRLLAEAFDAEERVFGVMLTDQIPTAIPDDVAGAADVRGGTGAGVGADAPDLLDAVEAYGTGWGVGEDGSVTAIVVLVSADEEAAEANVELFEARVADGISEVTAEPYADRVRVVGSVVDGRVTAFEVDVDPWNWFYEAALRRDPLVATTTG